MYHKPPLSPPLFPPLSITHTHANKDIALEPNGHLAQILKSQWCPIYLLCTGSMESTFQNACLSGDLLQRVFNEPHFLHVSYVCMHVCIRVRQRGR